MNTKWVIKPLPPTTDSLLQYLQDTVQLDPIAIKVLLKRNLRSTAEIEKFINPRLEDLYDPFLFTGMKEAVCLLEETISNQKRILIHGDYDVDGVTSTALLSRAFRALKVDHLTYIPDRLTEGYGLSRDAVAFAVKEQVSLIITVDCGISANDEVAYARERGIDVIITDHHRPSSDTLPAAAAIINFWQKGSLYPCKELTGVGIAFKVVQALTANVETDLLDLVALGTVSDVANIIDENRIFVKEGLKTLERKTNVGLWALRQVSGTAERKVSTADLGFVIGPRINATGRLGSAQNALKLLLTDDKAEAQQYALMLDQENKERQRIERGILEEALTKVPASDEGILVLSNRNWHQGVVGIIAARLVEKFHKPTVVIAIENDGIGKGSGRSVKGIDLFKLLNSCSDYLITFGGHEYAAGFEIHESNIPLLREKLNMLIQERYAGFLLEREIEVDLEITFYDIRKELIRNLELFKPYGRGNPTPVFLTRALTPMSVPTSLRGGGLKFSLYDGEIVFDAIWFKPAGFQPQRGVKYDVLYSLSFDAWFGFERVMLEVKDMQESTKSYIVGMTETGL